MQEKIRTASSSLYDQINLVFSPLESLKLMLCESDNEQERDIFGVLESLIPTAKKRLLEIEKTILRDIGKIEIQEAICNFYPDFIEGDLIKATLNNKNSRGESCQD